VLFTGFGKGATGFFTELEANNNRDWWLANKDRYDAEIRGPLEHVLADLADEFGEAKVFRPNRDTRFANDKSPYKTAAAAVIWEDGGSCYVQISASGLFTGGGCYHMDRGQLDRFRRIVADDDNAAGELERVLVDLQRSGAEIGGEQLVTAPRGYDREHPRIALLRRKGLVGAWDHGRKAWLHTAKARERIAEDWRRVAPLNAWFDAHVGPPVERER
jgi:uncharacterized protein (TIGR02453 family)